MSVSSPSADTALWKRFVSFFTRRCVAGDAVLPASKPQNHQVQTLFPCHLGPMVQNAEVEASFHWLDLLPRNGHQNCIHVHLGNLRKHAVCLRRCSRGRVSKFASQNQIRLSVDDQLSPNSRFRDPRYLRSVCNQRTQQAARNKTVKPRQYQSTISDDKNYCANKASETALPIAL